MRRIICLLLTLCLLAGAAASAEEEIGKLRHIYVNGSDYVQKTNLTVILLLGVDGAVSSGLGKARGGGQSDFIVLCVLDHTDKTIRFLQIDRDTMTQIPTTDIFGRRTGTKTDQICLAYAMGDGGKKSCSYASEAVCTLLEGAWINLYISMGMDGISKINNALGGVTVTVNEDITALDPALQKGAKVTLTDAQSEIFVRGRTGIGDQTNSSRMTRQRIYMESAASRFKSLASANKSFINTFLDKLEEVMITDMSRGRMFNELNRAYKYKLLPIERLEGEYSIGRDGFRQFSADSEYISAWVLANMYRINN
ncbi:MAG: LCP family protein [Clostridia bacterium]|nr:LCP family protein [Clostridia bacterium]